MKTAGKMKSRVIFMALVFEWGSNESGRAKLSFGFAAPLCSRDALWWIIQKLKHKGLSYTRAHKELHRSGEQLIRC